MPYTLSLVCYNQRFTSYSNIDPIQVGKYVNNRTDLKIEKEGNDDTLLIWYEPEAEWFPLLWFSSESNSINANPIFDYGLYYDLAKLAEFLGASIVTEDGYLLYTPSLGFLVDPDESKDIAMPVATIASVLETIPLDQLDLLTVYKQHSAEKKVTSTSPSTSPKIGKRTENFIVVAIVVVAILVFVLIKLFK